MRDIKFRAKRSDNGKMVFGDLLNGVGVKYNKKYIYPNVVLLPKDCHIMDGYEVDPKTIGQYTGLKDKNGTEIYEGDIVKTQNDFIRKIVYKDTAFHVIGVINGEKMTHLLYYQTVTNKSGIIDFEIIGNIYENPELL